MPCTSGSGLLEGLAGRAAGSLRGERGGKGGRQADGDREHRGMTRESGAAPGGTLTPDNMGGHLGGQDTAQACRGADSTWEGSATAYIN